ncbi:hypothetical protein RSOLAG1IB_09671 [Rhizoctonia solani AG-1 IB]|uniref:Uncharacterized protein n=1 Tax=Thanatephorus cucumeris (strain AG1-IB / isolate 7/3/14) TaxID=1108050 RepID=A0A0B7FW54_THACB|nr:hypothetical protein RSOLAG1IB_09671 [Rhizoctonia solani AG-1 IB]
MLTILLHAQLGASSAERRVASVDLQEAHASDIRPTHHRIELSGREIKEKEAKDNEEENDETESVDMQVGSAKREDPNE